jgi:ferrochelatase
VADCLETLEEIAQEASEAYLAAGGERFDYVPCLNAEPVWNDALAALAERHLGGWDTRQAPHATELEAQRQRALALGAKD